MTTPSSDRPFESVRPPRWAEALLRGLLPPDDAETISGDLLEEYRKTVYPLLGRRSADLWFLRQVGGFAWRATWQWGVLLAALQVGRNALDWLVPPPDFKVRSIVTTYTAISLFVAAGFWAAYRTRSFRASVLAGIATGAISFVLSVSGNLVLLAIWHDPQTARAIDYSGGLDEMFVLPGFAAVVGTFLASVGGLIGRGLRLARSG
jgi:hypothetical protein